MHGWWTSEHATYTVIAIQLWWFVLTHVAGHTAFIMIHVAGHIALIQGKTELKQETKLKISDKDFKRNVCIDLDSKVCGPRYHWQYTKVASVAKVICFTVNMRTLKNRRWCDDVVLSSLSLIQCSTQIEHIHVYLFTYIYQSYGLLYGSTSLLYTVLSLYSLVYRLPTSCIFLPRPGQSPLFRPLISRIWQMSTLIVLWDLRFWTSLPTSISSIFKTLDKVFLIELIYSLGVWKLIYSWIKPIHLKIILYSG